MSKRNESKENKFKNELDSAIADTKSRIKHFLLPHNFVIMLVAAGALAVVILAHKLGWAEALSGTGNWLVQLIDSVGWLAGGVFLSKLLDMVLVLALRGSAKAITVERMIHSFIKYVIAIVVVIGILIVWLGKEYIAGVLGGVGVLALVIGFGAQKLIGDVIAGVFMVFEGNIAVGDIVTINDWRGTVKEIGVRSTVLVSDGGDEKVLTNSVITEFVNLSRNASVAVVTANVDYATPVEKTEQVIKEGLGRIYERVPALLGKPDYKGIEEMGDNGYLVKIIGKCPESERFQTQRDLTKELMLLLQEGGVDLAFPQLDVHQRSDLSK